MKTVFLCLLSACLFCVVIQPYASAASFSGPVGKSKPAAISKITGESFQSLDQANEYYVDCSIGKITGDGHSPANAWHSLEAVNAHTFSGGDTIYFRRGSECHGLLWPKGSGSASATIRLSAYGKGPRPKIIAGNGDEQAFKLFDQEYWDVDSIDFSGGTVFGVLVSGQVGILHHIHLKNLLVHDVHGGEVKHKESGLVVISPGTVQQHFDDVLVEGIAAYGTDQWAGILIGGGNFGEVAEKDWSTHIVVRNSVVHDVYGDGIVLFRVKDGLIDNSAAWGTGMQPTQSIGTPNAIWTWMCTDCVVSRNEAFLTDSPGVDGGAFDIDWGNTRNSVLNNYAHDTQGYCIAVFAAGYITRDSVVEGNLCINNGGSPRMARYQGAIFLWTWNNGVIENLRVEKNTIFWTPPGNYPAVLNRADIQGAQRIFRENQTYSASASFIDSNKNLSFQANRYSTCGADRALWTFDNRAYDTFDKYRASSGQEQGSSWKPDSSEVCLATVPSAHKQRSDAAAFPDRRIEHAAKASTWNVIFELPASIGPDGLLDTASTGQLVVLKNLFVQFRASGLRTSVKLHLQHGISNESMENVIRDYSANGFEVVQSTASQMLVHPEIRFIAPDGSLVRAWQDYIGPAEIGLAVRRVLGQPVYSKVQFEDQ